MKSIDIIGKIFKNDAGLEYIVLREAGRNKNGTQMFCVKFLNTGYETYTTSGHIRCGAVKDCLSPSVCGVGCIGYIKDFSKRGEINKTYKTWRCMIRRCYDKSHRAYKWYGDKGVTVCDRWLRFDKFCEDVPKITGYDKAKYESGLIELDKDILSTPNKTYSIDTCCFVSHAENNREALFRRWNKALQ